MCYFFSHAHTVYVGCLRLSRRATFYAMVHRRVRLRRGCGVAAALGMACLQMRAATERRGVLYLVKSPIGVSLAVELGVVGLDLSCGDERVRALNH